MDRIIQFLEEIDSKLTAQNKKIDELEDKIDSMLATQIKTPRETTDLSSCLELATKKASAPTLSGTFDVDAELIKCGYKQNSIGEWKYHFFYGSSSAHITITRKAEGWEITEVIGHPYDYRHVNNFTFEDTARFLHCARFKSII